MVQPLQTHQQQQQLCGATLTRRQKARAESFFPPSLTNTRTHCPRPKSSQFCSSLHLQEGEENYTRFLLANPFSNSVAFCAVTRFSFYHDSVHQVLVPEVCIKTRDTAQTNIA